MAIKIINIQDNNFNNRPYYQTDAHSWTTSDINIVCDYAVFLGMPLELFYLSFDPETPLTQCKRVLKDFVSVGTLYVIDAELIDSVVKAGLITIIKDYDAVSKL